MTVRLDDAGNLRGVDGVPATLWIDVGEVVQRATRRLDGRGGNSPATRSNNPLPHRGAGQQKKQSEVSHGSGVMVIWMEVEAPSLVSVKRALVLARTKVVPAAAVHAPPGTAT